MTDNDLHYLQSILQHLRELRSLLSLREVDESGMLPEQVLADNIDWLDCFIDKHARALEPKP
jgi:hypothetical protein